MPDNFIESYLNHTQFYESPTTFWKWSAYSTISTVIRDKCYIRIADSLLFPNLYVLFLAESGGRKNGPVQLSQLLAEKVPSTKVLGGYASIQGVLDELARTESDGAGKINKSNSATLFAPEFTASVVPDPQVFKILTDLYDFKPNGYKHRLRTGPCFNLDKLVFSILGASNHEMLDGLFNAAIVRGGFLARTMLVTPNGEFRKGNALIRNKEEENDRLKKSREGLEVKIRKVAQVTGEFKFEEAAVEEYEKWYLDFREKYLRNNKDLTGILGRIHTHVLKLAMILAANDLTLCIKQKYIEDSINECLGLLPNYGMFSMNHAKTEIGTVGGIILNNLFEAKKDNYMLSRKILIRNNWQNFDIETMDKAIVALEAAQMIVQHQMKDGIYLQLTKQCLEMMS